jgi:hypothetical protein
VRPPNAQLDWAHPSEGYGGGFPGISPVSDGCLWKQKPAVKVKMPVKAIQALGRCSLTIDIQAARVEPQRPGDKGAAGPRRTTVHRGLFLSNHWTPEPNLKNLGPDHGAPFRRKSLKPSLFSSQISKNGKRKVAPAANLTRAGLDERNRSNETRCERFERAKKFATPFHFMKGTRDPIAAKSDHLGGSWRTQKSGSYANYFGNHHDQRVRSSKR